MNTQSGFSNHIRSIAFLSALFILLVAAAPNAMAKEGAPGNRASTQVIDEDPGCD